MQQFAMPRISFVIPIYNEEAVLDALRARMDQMMARTGTLCEVVLVNDGSRDSSLAMMDRIASEDPRYVIVNLSRNFGHQIAVTAGIDYATGDAVITMDADLQDPPEVALEMIARWREGYHVVLARRSARSGETFFKRASASLFYRGLRKLSSVDLPLDVGDFRLLDRCVVEAIKAMPEHDRYLRGMISWAGFNTTSVSFMRDERAAGESKYPLKAMVKLAFNGILGFSDVPLRLALWAGMAVSVLALAFGGYILLASLIGGHTVQGWTSTVLILTFLGGIQLMMLGVMGLYVGRIHNEVKRRPLYYVNSRHSLTERGFGNHQNPAKTRSGAGELGAGGASQRKVAGAEAATV